MVVKATEFAGVAQVGARMAKRFRTYGVIPHVVGAIARMSFTSAGIVVVAGWPPPRVINRGGRVEVGNCAFAGGVRIECWQGAKVHIGKGSYLNRGVEIVSASSVSIGRDCKVASDVVIMDTDQHPLPGRDLVVRPVTIEDRVWIGARAMILKGVSVGHDAIIGAGAVVTKDVPPCGVVVGNPARLIRVGTSPTP